LLGNKSRIVWTGWQDEILLTPTCEITPFEKLEREDIARCFQRDN